MMACLIKGPKATGPTMPGLKSPKLQAKTKLFPFKLINLGILL
jgi:hypothetical protein